MQNLITILRTRCCEDASCLLRSRALLAGTKPNFSFFIQSLIATPPVPGSSVLLSPLNHVHSDLSFTGVERSKGKLKLKLKKKSHPDAHP